MGKSTGPAKAFALKSQYVPVVRQAAQEAGVAPSDDEEDKHGPGQTNSKKRKLEGDGEEEKEKPPVWEYNKHRKAFIKNVMNAESFFHMQRLRKCGIPVMRNMICWVVFLSVSLRNVGLSLKDVLRTLGRQSLIPSEFR